MAWLEAINSLSSPCSAKSLMGLLCCCYKEILSEGRMDTALEAKLPPLTHSLQ